MVFGGRHAVGEGDGESVEGWLPSGDPSCLPGAFGVQAPGDQEEGLHRGLLVGEVPAGKHRPPVAGIQALDRVGRAQHPTDLNVVVQEWNELLPGAQPQLADSGVGPSPLVQDVVTGLFGRGHGRAV